jgi:hypothetical protein
LLDIGVVQLWAGLGRSNWPRNASRIEQFLTGVFHLLRKK